MLTTKSTVGLIRSQQVDFENKSIKWTIIDTFYFARAKSCFLVIGGQKREGHLHTHGIQHAKLPSRGAISGALI